MLQTGGVEFEGQGHLPGGESLIKVAVVCIMGNAGSNFSGGNVDPTCLHQKNICIGRLRKQLITTHIYINYFKLSYITNILTQTMTFT